MRVLSLAIVFLTIGSLGIVNSPHSLSTESIAQLDNLENIDEVTISVLDRLGYECDTIADLGLVCKKCSSENMLIEKCTAYICDAATKKCRKKNTILPQLPDSN